MRASWMTAGALLLIAAACGGDDGGTIPATTSTGGSGTGGVGGGDGGGGGCPAARQCGLGCCDAGEVCGGAECVPACEGGVLCGDPASCCAADHECLEAGCLPACASGVRCGADGMTCCGAGEVCVSEACVAPGDPCKDSFDCGLGGFCEPTIDKCLPQFDPVTCKSEPVFAPFSPVLEWSWTKSQKQPAHVHAVSAPIVIDLDGGGSPEVVVNASTGAFLGQKSYLRALAGDSGQEKWIAESEALQSAAGIAAADIDGDNLPEVLGISFDQHLVAFEHDGSLKWKSPFGMSGVETAGPTIADLDQDGTPEILVGGTAFDNTGKVLWDKGASLGSNAGYPGGFTAVADIDLDGKPEVVTGAKVFEHDGTPKYDLGADGYPAIANFDADPQPEIVLVANGVVTVYDGLSGKAEYPAVAIAGGGRGGPPTVADFDGDGAPEIGVAGGSNYLVIDPDGSPQIKWLQPTQDASSNVTGSSVFDFEGDGAGEVVYADECYLRVYDGKTGMVKLEVENTSGTGHEYPLVADVDGDGNSELVVVANAWSCPHNKQLNGVFVYGDANDRWVPTRRIWNQHAYHVTNVSSSGAVPKVEANNWQTPGLNNYRTNVQGEGVFNAPDLLVTLAVTAGVCGGKVTLQATVENDGSLGVLPGVAVGFYRGKEAKAAELIGTVQTTTSLLPGQSEKVTLETQLPANDQGPFDFLAVVDDAADGGAVAECLEDNNTSLVAGVFCSARR